jgi:hypothetical protein
MVLPRFTADQTGSYEVTLVVNDGQASSLPDRVSVIVGAPAGTQTLMLGRESYLATWREVTVAEGQTLSLPDVTLLGGDVNGDDRIGQIDGARSAWPGTRPPPAPSGAARPTSPTTGRSLCWTRSRSSTTGTK